MSFKFTINRKATNFIKELRNKYNILIMTENRIDDFEKILMGANLKN